MAKEEHERSPRKVAHPASVGAIVHLGRCFDLLDTRNTELLSALYPKFCAAFSAAGKAIPENRGIASNAADLVLRRLDCAVINWALPQLERDLETRFQTVRGVFTEGVPAFPGSGIMAKSHIQIAVRDPRCIVGVFEPRS